MDCPLCLGPCQCRDTSITAGGSTQAVLGFLSQVSRILKADNDEDGCWLILHCTTYMLATLKMKMEKWNL